MYQGAQGAQAGQGNPFEGQQAGAQQEAPKDDNIQDADFEEVKKRNLVNYLTIIEIPYNSTSYAGFFVSRIMYTKDFCLK